jgi:hypothetical protein
MLNNLNDQADVQCYSNRSSFKMERTTAKNSDLSEDINSEYSLESSLNKSTTFSNTSSPTTKDKTM